MFSPRALNLGVDRETRCVFALIVRSSNVIVWETASRRASFMLAPQNKDAAGAAGMHVAVGGVQQDSTEQLRCAARSV